MDNQEIKSEDLRKLIIETNIMVRSLFNRMTIDLEQLFAKKKAREKTAKPREESCAGLVRKIMQDGATHTIYDLWQTLGGEQTCKEKAVAQALVYGCGKGTYHRIRKGLYQLKQKEKQETEDGIYGA